MAHIRSLKRIIKNIEKLKNLEYSDAGQITVGLQQLEDEWQYYVETKKQVLERDDSIEYNDKIEDLHFDLKMELREKLLTYKNPQENLGNATMDDLVLNQKSFISEIKCLNNSEADVKLPEIQVPVFSGIYEEFPSFKDLFEAAIDSNTKLSDVHKLQYLKGVLKGEAAKLVRHVKITDANYKETWEIIKARYDRKNQVVTGLVKQFIDQPHITQANAKSLHHMADVSVEVLRCLKVLGPEAERRDPWLVAIITNKLDSGTRRCWSKESFNEDFPSIEKLIQFLNQQAHILEDGDNNKRNLQTKTKPLHGLHTSNSVSRCLSCKEDHSLHQCNQFLKLTLDERKAFIKQNKMCFNCLKQNHFTNKCKSRFSCRTCGRRHHTIIHQEQNNNDQNKEELSPGENLQLNATWIKKFGSILPTARVHIKDINGKQQVCRIMLDSAAESSFVSESCVRRLNLQRKNARIPITGLTDGIKNTRGFVNLNLTSISSSKSIEICALILNKLNCRVPSNKINIENKNLLNHFRLADPDFYVPAEIDVIIGADKFFQVITEGKKTNAVDSLTAQNTIFGWVLAGEVHSKSKDLPVRAYNSSILVETLNIDKLITKFWEAEEEPSSKILSAEDEFCEKFFNETTTRKNNRFEVKLPLKTNRDLLGESKQIAVKRLNNLEKQLERSPALKQEYHNVLLEYIDMGHMKKIMNEVSKTSYYLPHRAVLKNSSSTKLRVVFDGSSKSSTGVSLNDILCVGPTIQPTLWSTIIRFRQHKYVMTSDIEKMYRQVLLHPEDQVLQKILWRDEKTNNIETYQLTTVTFGLASSAYLAIKSLQQCALDMKKEFPRASNIILQDFYVDDLLTGADTKEEIRILQNEIVKILDYGGFKLRKWRSNLKDHSDLKKNDNITKIDDSAQKILGLQWDAELDQFFFSINNIEETITTKRKLISEASRIFDPIGWLTPFTILIKILFQKLWILKVEWDEPIPSSVAYMWRKIKTQIPDISKIRIPRYTPSNHNIQLHGFSDASERAYAAVVYIRAPDSKGTMQVNLITSKSKVAPIKQISLPRLELCGAHLLAKLLNSVIKNLKIVPEIYAWTDSTIVLHWLNDHPSRWKTYIGNRTSQILSLCPTTKWNHIKSADNPADYSSRGVFPSELCSLSLWWYGPQWLKKDSAEWPDQTALKEIKIAPEISEERNNFLNVFYAKSNSQNETLENLLKNTNSFTKLIRIICYIRRFGSRTKSNVSHKPYLTIKELNEAKLILIKYVQFNHYQQDINELKKHKQTSKSSKLISLAPFLDEQGILRVGGRIKNATLPYSQKFPIILRNSDNLSKLIILYFHSKYLHPGATLTSHLIRQEFWIVQGRGLIRNLIQKCVICFKHKPRIIQQQMGNLPSCRLNPARPFTNTGVDFAGPILISSKKGRGAKHIKAYVAVFICMITKAVQKILWRDEKTNNIETYQLTTVTFGLASSAYLAIKSLQQCALDMKKEFPRASNIILQVFYVDDLLTEQVQQKNNKTIPESGCIFQKLHQAPKFLAPALNKTRL